MVNGGSFNSIKDISSSPHTSGPYPLQAPHMREHHIPILSDDSAFPPLSSSPSRMLSFVPMTPKPAWNRLVLNEVGSRPAETIDRGGKTAGAMPNTSTTSSITQAYPELDLRCDAVQHAHTTAVASKEGSRLSHASSAPALAGPEILVPLSTASSLSSCMSTLSCAPLKENNKLPEDVAAISCRSTATISPVYSSLSSTPLMMQCAISQGNAASASPFTSVAPLTSEYNSSAAINSIEARVFKQMEEIALGLDVWRREKKLPKFAFGSHDSVKLATVARAFCAKIIDCSVKYSYSLGEAEPIDKRERLMRRFTVRARTELKAGDDFPDELAFFSKLLTETNNAALSQQLLLVIADSIARLEVRSAVDQTIAHVGPLRALGRMAGLLACMGLKGAQEKAFKDNIIANRVDPLQCLQRLKHSFSQGRLALTLPWVCEYLAQHGKLCSKMPSCIEILLWLEHLRRCISHNRRVRDLFRFLCILSV